MLALIGFFFGKRNLDKDFQKVSGCSCFVFSESAKDAISNIFTEIGRARAAFLKVTFDNTAALERYFKIFK